MVSVSTPYCLNSSVMSSSSLPVEDASEESEDFKVPFKASAFKDTVTPVVWDGGHSIGIIFGKETDHASSAYSSLRWA